MRVPPRRPQLGLARRISSALNAVSSAGTIAGALAPPSGGAVSTTGSSLIRWQQSVARSAAASAASRAACSSISRTTARARLTALFVPAARDHLIEPSSRLVTPSIAESAVSLKSLFIATASSSWCSPRWRRRRRRLAPPIQRRRARDRAEQVGVFDPATARESPRLRVWSSWQSGRGRADRRSLPPPRGSGFRRRLRTPSSARSRAWRRPGADAVASRSSRAIAASSEGTISLATAAFRTRILVFTRDRRWSRDRQAPARRRTRAAPRGPDFFLVIVCETCRAVSCVAPAWPPTRQLVRADRNRL